jgi:hypothetical protein
MRLPVDRQLAAPIAAVAHATINSEVLRNADEFAVAFERVRGANLVDPFGRRTETNAKGLRVDAVIGDYPQNCGSRRATTCVLCGNRIVVRRYGDPPRACR